VRDIRSIINADTWRKLSLPERESLMKLLPTPPNLSGSERAAYHAETLEMLFDDKREDFHFGNPVRDFGQRLQRMLVDSLHRMTRPWRGVAWHSILTETHRVDCSMNGDDGDDGDGCRWPVSCQGRGSTTTATSCTDAALRRLDGVVPSLVGAPSAASKAGARRAGPAVPSARLA